MSGGLDIPLRSLLFAPGHDERKLAKAIASGADAVVADLEDAVAPAAKEEARAAIARAFAEAGGRAGLMVRINAVGTPWVDDDLAFIADLRPSAIVVPKALPADVGAVAERALATPLIPIVETAQGVRLAYEVAAAPGVEALMFGAIDLAGEISFDPVPDGSHLVYARSKVAVDSAAAGIAPPIDSAYPHLSDDDGLGADARAARAVGFRGKCCIHPRQLPLVHAVFSPSPDELDWATRTIAAYEEAAASGDGVLAVGTEMVDLATVRRARRILREDAASASPTTPAGGTT